MLEKLAAGMLGSAVTGLLDGLTGGTKKTDKTAATGFEDILAGSKTKSEAEEMGINESDSMSAGTQDALGLLREMTSGGVAGYFKWMVKQIREKVMDDMGVSDAQLAAMPADQRQAIEDKIAEEVKKQVSKIMGVEPDEAEKMIAAADKVQDTAAVNKADADKAYKDGGSSAAEMLSQLMQ